MRTIAADYSIDSTVHGVSHIGRNRNPTHTFWLITMLVCMSALVFQVFLLILKFLAFEKQTNIAVQPALLPTSDPNQTLSSNLGHVPRAGVPSRLHLLHVSLQEEQICRQRQPQRPRLKLPISERSQVQKVASFRCPP